MQELDKEVKCFCILAGGGVRGTSYVGVLRYMEEKQITITGMAGSSVGAIFSSLYSIGYTADELGVIADNLNYENLKDLYLPFGKDFGICKGDNFLNWFRKLIEYKFYGDEYDEEGNIPVTFADLDKDLFVIATDVTHVKLKEFSRYATPDMEIAQAVRASISIPGFFRPVWHDNYCLVDGDIIKNLPLWDIIPKIGEVRPEIVEFKLEAVGEDKVIKNPFDFFNAVVDTATNISTDFVIDLYGKNDKYNLVKINTENVSVVDFSISQEKKQWLVEKGYMTAKNAFENTMFKKKQNLREIYIDLKEHLYAVHDLVKKGRISLARERFGDLFLELAQNSEILDAKIYKKVIKVKEMFIENLSKNILGMWVLKNKERTALEIKYAAKKIKKRIRYMDLFLDKFKNED